MADLTAELRELKARSRLTYRQLEERAARQGEQLPRSTLADVLRNGSLPRQELLTAFVRACGEGDHLSDWLAARRRAAQSLDRAGGTGGTGASAGSGGADAPAGGAGAGRSGDPGATGGFRDPAGARGPGDPGGPEGARGPVNPGGPEGARRPGDPGGPVGGDGGPGAPGGFRDPAGPGGDGRPAGPGGEGRAAAGAGGPVRRFLSSAPYALRGRRGRVLAGSFLAVVLVAAGAWALRDPDGPGRAGDPSPSPPAEASVPLPRGAVLLRPLGSPGLCVTDGKAADGRYGSLVAVQRPCDETAPQTTTLDPVGQGAYRISWYRPDQGKGCLKALTSGPAEGLLEPWEACEQTTVFRFLATGPAKTVKSGKPEKSAGRSYLIKVPDGRCVGIRDASTAPGTEAVVEPCTGTDAQLFTVEAAL